MKYQSELVKEIVDSRGHEKSSLHYQSECIEAWIQETKGAYPKLCDYEGEWLNYITNEEHIGEFPYETVTANPTATVNNVVPYAYKSAILKGNTGYRDIDTGEILETFEEGRNLELVSVKMPVLTTVGRNLVDEKNFTKGYIMPTGVIDTGSATNSLTDYIRVKPNTSYAYKAFVNGSTAIYGECAYYNKNKNFISRNTKGHSNNECIITPSDCYYIRFWNPLYVENGNVHPKCMIVETTQLPSTLSKYEPFKSNILTVNEELTLRGIGEVQDTLNCLTGEVVERVGEITLDGSDDELWDKRTNSTTDYIGFYILLNNINPKPVKNSVMINDKFITINDKIWNVLDREGIYIGGSAIAVSISKSKLSSEDVNGFKEWLQLNPISLQYQLATESIKTVDLNVTNQNGESIGKIKPIEGTMHISVSGTPISPTALLEVPVEAITQNLSSFIGE